MTGTSHQPGTARDTHIAFHAVAHAFNSKPINHGQLYADARDSPHELRVWAAALFRNPAWRVGHVTIEGQQLHCVHGTWMPTGKHYTFERVDRDTPVELTTADRRKICYRTTSTGNPTMVHERRSDGSCLCGVHQSRYPTHVPAIDNDAVVAALDAYARQDWASPADTPAAQQAYQRARAALTIPEQVELDHLVCAYLCASSRPTPEIDAEQAPGERLTADVPIAQPVETTSPAVMTLAGPHR